MKKSKKKRPLKTMKERYQEAGAFKKEYRDAKIGKTVLVRQQQRFEEMNREILEQARREQNQLRGKREREKYEQKLEQKIGKEMHKEEQEFFRMLQNTD